MQSFFYIASFLLGAIIGSFLNVVIYRYNTGHSVRGRSRCMSCVRTLSWYELVPVFSFAAQKGKCRGCLSKIAWQYPLVELSGGLIFLLIAMTGHTAATKLYGLIVFSILLVIAVYDLRHTIIPDGPVFLFVFMGFLRLFLSGGLSIVDLYSGFLIALFFAALWYVSGGRWMGFGDAKLALGIGWFLPYPFNVTAIILGFWIGAAAGVAMLYLPKMVRAIAAGFGADRSVRVQTLGSEIPFAPFLALGAFVTFLYPFTLW